MRIKKRATPIAARAATPPTTPPAIAPTFVLLPPEPEPEVLVADSELVEVVAVDALEPSDAVVVAPEDAGPEIDPDDNCDGWAGSVAKKVYPVRGASSHQNQLKAELDAPRVGSRTWLLQNSDPDAPPAPQ